MPRWSVAVSGALQWSPVHWMPSGRCGARGAAGGSVRYTGQMVHYHAGAEVRPARPGGRAAGGPGRPGSSDGPAPALRRGLAVLQLLAARPAPVSAAAIARDLGLPRSTTYELLTELAAAGFAVHLPGERRWGLGLSAFEIGSAYLRGEPLERIGRPVIARLSAATSTTAHLGVLHGAETLYLGKERRSEGLLTLVTEVGVRLPAALTATGLSILAYLPAEQVRAVFPDRASFVVRTGRGPDTLPALRRDLATVRRRGLGRRGRPGLRGDGVGRRRGLRPQRAADRRGRRHLRAPVC